MPYCPLFLSCDLSKAQVTELSLQLHDALVSIADKPPTAIMINILPNAHLSLNGVGDAAYFEIQAVGMTEEGLIERLGAKFTDIIHQVAGISYNRIFVHFQISEPATWIIRGRSLSDWKTQWKIEGKKGFDR